jgi:hypothetical protein
VEASTGDICHEIAVHIGAGIASMDSDRSRATTSNEGDKPMAPKATRKSSKELKKGKKIQPVKNLRLAVRKASGTQPVEF